MKKPFIKKIKRGRKAKQFTPDQLIVVIIVALVILAFILKRLFFGI